MSPNSDTLSWSRDNQSLLFLFNVVCLVKQKKDCDFEVSEDKYMEIWVELLKRIGKNKLIYNEMMMRSALYYTNTFSV
jgi:hypothetical protein